MLLQDELGRLSVLFYFFDDVVIVNRDGIIEYAETLRPDLYSVPLKEIIGKHIYDTYEKLDGNPGSLHEVLKTGIPVFNRVSRWKTLCGDAVHTSTSTLPIIREREIVGVIEGSRFIGDDSNPKQIHLERVGLRPPKAPGREQEYYTLEDIVTRDPVMLSIKEKIAYIADYDVGILIGGETGTGKEVVAQAVHSMSRRGTHPFISQNCAALPESLAEAILFGTERGSFTSAETKKGLFELAQGGTLFLDEVSSMSLPLQAKLLKAIEEKRIRKLGGQKTIATDIRVISALNEDPFELIREKRLRSDLFYRLNTVSIQLPPLKDRRGDVALLADYYIRYYNHLLGVDIKGLSPAARELLGGYSWPGNVRELKNALESAYHNKPGEWIEPEHLPEHIGRSVSQGTSSVADGAISFRSRMESYEKQVLMEACRGAKTKTEAARLLQISKQSLNYRLSKFGLA